MEANWAESKHPREDDGKFAPKGGGAGGSSSGPTPSPAGPSGDSGQTRKTYDAKKWAKSLSRSQRFSVQQYMADKKTSSALNDALRHGTPLTKEQELISKDIHAAIASAGKHDPPLRVYRGARLPRAVLNSVLQEAGSGRGTRVTLGGIQSTSINPNVAATWAGVDSDAMDPGTSGVIYDITTDEGAPVHEIAGDVGRVEREVLLAHGRSYDVIGVRSTPYMGSNIPTLVLRKVPDNG